MTENIVEWDIISNTDWDAVRVGQILIELHDFGSNYALKDLIGKFIGRLEQAGYFLFSTEPVCQKCSGQYEVAFINRNWRPSMEHSSNGTA